MKKYFLLGLIIKSLLVAFTFHLDTLFIWERPAHFIQNLPTISSYYGPLTYITFGILSPIYFLSQHVGYWILKIPYFFLDIYILYLLLKLSHPAIHKKILIYWWLNPIIIFSTYAIGQVDIILSLCVALSVYTARKHRVFSILSIGAGVAYKTMTLPLLIPSALILGKSVTDKIKMMLIGISVPFVFALLFWLPAHSNVVNTYFPTGIIFYPRLSTTPDSIWEYLSLFAGIIGFFVVQYLVIKNKTRIYNLKYALFTSLSFVIIALPIYSIFRYTLLMPLLVLISLKMKKTFTLTLILILLPLGYLYIWPLEWGLIAHIYPQVKNLPALREWIAPLVNYENIALALRIIADSLIFYMAILSLKKMFIKIKRNQSSGHHI